MKLAIISCYKQPDYIRGFMLRKIAATIPDVEVITVKNRHLGELRYPEVILRIIGLRLKHRPDMYIITFRAYEILPFAALLTWPKKLLYDELINPFEWIEEPGREKKAKLIPMGFSKWLYRLVLKRVRFIIADTDVHAAYSAGMSELPQSRYVTLPVGADEALFKPRPSSNPGQFRVFYIGNMLPLHGLPHVIEAAKLLKDLPIEFRIIGGKESVVDAIEQAQDEGARISYDAWIPFDAIASEISSANLCLAGPYGNTTQASMVITGKAYQFLASAAPTLIGKNKASGLFKNKENCLSVPLGDSNALADSIKWAYEHQGELKTIGKRGYDLYMKEFSEKVLATKVADLLKAAS